MSIENAQMVKPRIYKYSQYEALSLKVSGRTEVITLVDNQSINGGEIYPTDPIVYEVPINGSMLIMASGNIDDNATLIMEYAFDEENWYTYKEVPITISSDKVTFTLVQPFLSGYWRFKIKPTTTGIFTIKAKFFG